GSNFAGVSFGRVGYCGAAGTCGGCSPAAAAPAPVRAATGGTRNSAPRAAACKMWLLFMGAGYMVNQTRAKGSGLRAGRAGTLRACALSPRPLALLLAL